MDALSERESLEWAMAESVPVRCPACRREHLYAAPTYPCVCGAPVATPLDGLAEPMPVTHRAWDDEWTAVRCGACGRETQWPHPELGCPCGTTLRLPLRPPPDRAAPERGPDGARGRGPQGERGPAADGAAEPDAHGRPGRSPEGGPDRALGQGPGGEREQSPGGGTRPGPDSTRGQGPASGAEPASHNPPGQGPESRPERGPDGWPDQEPDSQAEQGPDGRDEHASHNPPGQGPESRRELEAGGRGEQGPGGRGGQGHGGGEPGARVGPWAGGNGRRPAFRPVVIRTARDAVTAAALYLGWLGYRDIRRADQRPPSGIGLAARGILAQVDPTVRPASLRDVECLWLTAMTESSQCVFFSLAGYAEDARARADTLGVPLFVLDLTGTPQPVNGPADELVAVTDRPPAGGSSGAYSA